VPRTSFCAKQFRYLSYSFDRHNDIIMKALISLVFFVQFLLPNNLLAQVANMDTKSEALADLCMAAMGGEEAWETARYFQWNFFGSRKHTWDKEKNIVMIQGIREPFNMMVNLNDLTGMVKMDDVVHTQPDSLKKYLAQGRDMWRNDSYWLFMPFKLKDPGVTLKYIGKKEIETYGECDQVQMTFEEVGKTPDNKYIISFDPKTNLIIQWDFYAAAADTEPRFASPWKNYQTFGKLLLSDDRGKYKITEIKTGSQLSTAFK